MVKRVHRYLAQFQSTLWILSVGWFVGALGFAVSIPFISIYFYSELGLSMSEIGAFFGVMAIVRSVFQALGGEFSDRMERRYLLIHSQIIRAGAFLLLAFSIFYNWGFWAIAGSLFINSIFGAVFQPAANAMVADILPRDKRLDGYAITRSAGNLGWAVGPAIGGFLAEYSYGLLFVISGVITFLSGLFFLFFLKSPKTTKNSEPFKFSDLLAIRNDPYIAKHSLLIFFLYLVVAQLIAPFSVYTVEMAGISEYQLGVLYTLNGLMVVFLQIPVTKLLSKRRFTVQLAMGAFVYVIGYSLVGFWSGFSFFILAMIVITLGEIFMSPASLALTSSLAPEGRMGRYMGIFGFFVASGWSFGPLYGGIILDHLGGTPEIAWVAISSIALIAGLGYLSFRRQLPLELDIKK